MTLSIESEEVERLLAEVVKLTGESKTEAVRRALRQRRDRLRALTVSRHEEADPAA